MLFFLPAYCLGYYFDIDFILWTLEPVFFSYNSVSVVPFKKQYI